MQMNQQQPLPVPALLAWEALNDMSLIQAAIPGCEGIDEIAPGEYEVVVVAAIGPVKARFKGRLTISDIVAPTSYKLAFEGQGGAAGHAKGTAAVVVQSQGEDESLLDYSVHATVGGKIAQVGSRLIDMAANKLAKEFFEKFTAAVVERHTPAAPEVPDAAADSTEAADGPEASEGRAKGWFRKLVGKG